MNPCLLYAEKSGCRTGFYLSRGSIRTSTFIYLRGGLRCAGEAPCRFIGPVNGVNFVHLLVDQALLGKAERYNGNLEDPSLKGKCCVIVSFATKGGRVSAIRGLEEAIANTPSVISHECRYPVGADTPSGNTLRQILLRFVMICESREQMAKDIRYINETVSVSNEKGEDMCLRFDPNQLFEQL